jgi:hypothetical protein
MSSGLSLKQSSQEVGRVSQQEGGIDLDKPAPAINMENKGFQTPFEVLDVEGEIDVLPSSPPVIC